VREKRRFCMRFTTEVRDRRVSTADMSDRSDVQSLTSDDIADAMRALMEINPGPIRCYRGYETLHPYRNTREGIGPREGRVKEVFQRFQVYGNGEGHLIFEDYPKEEL